MRKKGVEGRSCWGIEGLEEEKEVAGKGWRALKEFMGGMVVWREGDEAVG